MITYYISIGPLLHSVCWIHEESDISFIKVAFPTAAKNPLGLTIAHVHPDCHYSADILHPRRLHFQLLNCRLSHSSKCSSRPSGITEKFPGANTGGDTVITGGWTPIFWGGRPAWKYYLSILCATLLACSELGLALCSDFRHHSGSLEGNYL